MSAAVATCNAPGCRGTQHGKGWCRAHYMRMWRHGSLDLPARRVPTMVERLDRNTTRDPQTGCWLWTGTLRADGYGVINVRRKLHYVHRASYEARVGPIPEGLTIDHLCRTPRCINPDHLEPVTSAENTRRGTSPIVANARKTHCPKGHPLAPPHLYTRKNGRGRFCRTCAAERSRQRLSAVRTEKIARPCEQCGGPLRSHRRRRFCADCARQRDAARKADYLRRRRA